MIEYRWYQKEAIDAAITQLKTGSKDSFIIAAPTGAGKSYILAGLIARITKKNILVISHVKEILQQDIDAIETLLPDEPIAVFSASLGKRQRGRVTVAGIQSIYKKATLFKNTHLLLIDESHRINHKDEGMYRDLIRELDVPVIGLTATPYRMGQGMQTDGDTALFNKIIYDLTSFEKFNRLLAEGHLCNLITKETKTELDVSGVRITAGEFNKADLSHAVDRKNITQMAVAEIAQYKDRYKRMLIFCIDIEHAEHVQKYMLEAGINTGIVHSQQKEDRSIIMDKFLSGEYDALCNVDICTTGLDSKEIDLLGMLRPTQSPGLYCQMVGRALRPHPNKPHALVLDFAGNMQRHGPINDIRIKKKYSRSGKGGGGEPIVKKCPECDALHHPTVKFCECGYEFEFKQKIKPKAATYEIIKKEFDPVWFDVDAVRFAIHKKRDRPPSIKVIYTCGIRSFTEWYAVDHPERVGEISRLRFKKDFIKKHVQNKNITVNKILDHVASLHKPSQIKLNMNKQYPEVIGKTYA